MRKDMTSEQAIKSVKAERKWFQNELDKPMDESLTSEEIYVSGYYECQATCKNRVDAFNLAISALEKQPELLAEVERLQAENHAMENNFKNLASQNKRLINRNAQLAEQIAVLKSERDDYIGIGEEYRKGLLKAESERDVAKVKYEGAVKVCAAFCKERDVVARALEMARENKCFPYGIDANDDITAAK